MDKVPNISATQSSPVACPSCGSHDLTSSDVIEQFQYGNGTDVKTLSAGITVRQCHSCGLSFTTEDASEAKHDAICRHLGVFTPKEVRMVRERHDLSQADFAILTKIGTASLSRWEGGLVIQNQANDYYLYLLTFKDNIDRLRDRVRRGIRPEIEVTKHFVPKFRCISEADAERLSREADHFELYLEAA